MNLILFTALCFFILSMGNTFAQEIEKTRIYETRSNIAAYPCDILGTQIYANNRFNIPPYKARFAVVKTVNDSKSTPMVVVRFLNWKVIRPSNSKRSSASAPTSSTASSTSAPVSSKPSPINPSVSSTTVSVGINRNNTQLRKEFNDPLVISRDDKNLNNEVLASSTAIQTETEDTSKIYFDRYFLIAKTDLDSNCAKLFNWGWSTSVFTLGLVTMPMKIRLGSNFDFQGNLSLGTTAGVKMRISQYNPNYANFLVGLSLSTVSLDSFSTSGRINGQPLTNIGVFSPSVGAVLDFGRAQVGAFVGLDYLNKSTQIKYDWLYDRKPWISIGFGFSIFSVDGKANKSGETEQAATKSK